MRPDDRSESEPQPATPTPGDSSASSVIGERLSEWASRLAPQLEIVSASTPEPELEAGNVIAVFVSTEDARMLLKSWERIESADRSVGFVALGTAPGGTPTDDPDPEGVVREAAWRALGGGAVGAVVGVAIAVVIGIAFGWGAGAIAGVFGGALFGAVAGAVSAYVLKSGWGDSYRESYVDPQATAFAVCAIACERDDHREAAIAAAREASARQVLVVEAGGRIRQIAGPQKRR